MEFFVYETGETVRAARRPIVVITSNNEKELPDAFLRRCFFHYIRFPDPETMRAIVEAHYPGVKQRLVEEALRIFFDLREAPGPEEKTLDLGTARLAEIAAQRGYFARNAARARSRRKLIPPLHGALLKNEQDVHLFERLAFLNRRER